VAFNFLAALAISPFYLTILARGTFGPVWVSWAAAIMILVCPLVANGAMTYGVVRDLQGRPAPMLETLAALARRFLPMTGVAISLTLLVFLGCVLEAIVIGRFLPILYTGPVWTLLPAAVVLCIFFVATPVCVVEQAGIGRSLWRSMFLTKDYRWTIFGAFILILVPDIAVSAAASIAPNWMRVHTEGPIAFIFFLDSAASWVVETVFVAFLSVVTAVFYYELRAAKDGVKDAKVAGAFD
jgi:hypothetical protein